MAIALKVLYAGKEKIYPACVSNINREEHVIFLLIQKGKG